MAVEDPVGRPFNGRAEGGSSASLAQPDLGSVAGFTWQKSSYCGYNGDCVEVADMGPEIGVRDSKAGSASPVLRFDRAAWAAFVADIKAAR